MKDLNLKKKNNLFCCNFFFENVEFKQRDDKNQHFSFIYFKNDLKIY